MHFVDESKTDIAVLHTQQFAIIITSLIYPVSKNR